MQEGKERRGWEEGKKRHGKKWRKGNTKVRSEEKVKGRDKTEGKEQQTKRIDVSRDKERR